MSIKFTKMHGLANDFMVIDGVSQKIQLSPERIAQWSNRHTGIGFDQCLLIEPSNSAAIDFNYRIFNADGQEVGQCGNGARCLALFIQRYGLSNKQTLTVATKTTHMQLNLNQDGSVTVDMGQPKLQPQDIPLLMPNQQALYELPLKNGASATLHALSLGNPHAVLLVDELAQAPVEDLGQELSTHPAFPEHCNIGFMQIISPEHIKLRVYERGCGETKACGSGAVAAAAIGRLYHGLAQEIRVSLLGGELKITWPNTKEAIYLSGPADFVYEGELL